VTKSVAVDGQVEATPGTIPHPPADAGEWKAGLVVYETHAKLKVDGELAIEKAECTFSFFGTNSQAVGALVTASSTVELVAGSTKLKESGRGMLLAEDYAEDHWGNKLAAQTTNILKTA
jgi:hypothetical protein